MNERSTLFSLKGRIGIGLGVIGGIIIASYFGFYIPQLRTIERTKREIIQRNLTLKQLKGKIEEYEKVREECEELERKLSYYEKIHLSNRDQIYSLLQELGIRGRTYGISYTKMVPEKTIRGEYYDSIPIRIHLYSTYHALGRLLSEIAGRQEITSINIENIQTIKKTQDRSKERYTIEVDLILFVYTPKSGEQLETSSLSRSGEKKIEVRQSAIKRRRR